MKNYSLPDYISPTLELDEINRLKVSLKKNISKEDYENVLALLPINIEPTPDGRAKWVEEMTSLLESQFDDDTVRNIRKDCYCNENGRLEETAKNLKEIYIKSGKSLEKFVDTLNESGAGWYIKENHLYTKMVVCECPMLENANASESLTWCHCTAGYNKKLFEIIFEREVNVEILQSIRQGFEYCLLDIIL